MEYQKLLTVQEMDLESFTQWKKERNKKYQRSATYCFECSFCKTKKQKMF